MTWDVIPSHTVANRRVQARPSHFKWDSAASARRAAGDLVHPPSNRLKMFKGERKGQMSLRINDQWRICFRWNVGDAHAVEVVDYH